MGHGLRGLDTGWTFYTPYSTSFSNTEVVKTGLGIFIIGFSSILTGLNFIVTIHKMRAPGLTWFRLPLFVWAHYATSIFMILALFGNADPIGKKMLVQGHPFTVLGVTEKSRLGSMIGEADNYVYVPYGTFHKMMPWEEYHQLLIQAKSGLRAQAMDEAENLLRRRRDVKYSEPNNFSMTTADTLVKQLDRITGIIGMVAIAISSVGLLVGGIGVMNIMLVSVTERTREIGVRKAIGATKSDIVLQFLFEAMTLTGIGGIFGIILAIAISWFLRKEKTPYG